MTTIKKGTIIFDLDDTLFDARSLKEDIFKLLASSGISLEIVRTTYAKIREQFPIYRIEHHVKLLEQETGISISPEIEHQLHHFDRSPYVSQETKRLLEDLASEYELWLLSLGENVTQMKKITDTDLMKYFHEERIVITEDPKEKMISTIPVSGKVFFVNDKLRETVLVAEHQPNFVCVVIGDHNLENHKNLFGIPSVQQIKNILS